MKIKVLASGSKGNCSLIETKSTRFLIDIDRNNLSKIKKRAREDKFNNR